MDYRIWKPKGEPRAIVQLVHGMAEHIGRYDRVAQALNAAGYLAAGRSHRGHGPQAERLGWFAQEKGWDALVEDAHSFSQDIRKEYPHLPFILLGHSMGSFVSREYALRYGTELSALVLSGTGSYGRGLCTAAQAAARLSPSKKPAKMVDRLAFSGHNKPFSPNRTPFDWLSRDEAEVDKYIADPYCGFVFTGAAFADFFGGLKKLADTERLSSLPKGLPVYFLSGDQDPVGQMGKGVEKTAAQFKNAGLRDVTVKLYPGGRHEMFNETNRQEVYDDLIAWLNQRF